MVSGNKITTNVLKCFVLFDSRNGNVVLLHVMSDFGNLTLKKNTYFGIEDVELVETVAFLPQETYKALFRLSCLLLDLCLLVVFSLKWPWNSPNLDNLVPYSQLSEPNPKGFLGGDFQYFLCSPLFGEGSHFD